ncbi:hypothetical protein EV368DRAFT_78375 [Lentinula lateritia]|nr:hypothetical protein EV368DRAFT_78375 [Lentinula lateritia]
MPACRIHGQTLAQGGPLPDHIPPRTSVVVSVFLNISECPEKAPSEGATASTFIDGHKSKPHRHWEAPAGRLLQRRYSLFHAEFAQLKEAIVSGPLDRDSSPLRHKCSKELSGFFDDEKSNDYAVALVQAVFLLLARTDLP